MENKRVWLYCRIANQSVEDVAMANQVEYLKRYALERGYLIAGISAEYGTGLTLDRPGLLEITQAVLEKQIDAVLIKNLSRLARSYVLMPEYINFLNDNGVELIALSEGIRFHDHTEDIWT